MIRLLTDGVASHLVVLGAWALAAIVLIGLGAPLRAWWGLRFESWRDASQSFWLGLGVAIAILQVWHLALPVNGTATLALIAAGLAGLWRSRHTLARTLGTTDVRLASGAFLLLAWVANRALGPVELFDTGMYHQPTVAWTNAFAIVPGLGNLHGRLAFNSTALLFAAPFDVGPLDGAAVHLVTSLLVAALVVEGSCAWASARGSRHPRAFDLLTLAILPRLIHAAVRPDVRSLSTDAAVFAVLFVAVRELVDWLAHPASGRDDQGRRGAAIVFLFTLAITVKLSAAAVALTGVVLVGWMAGRARPEDPRIGTRQFLAWVTPSAMLFGVWLVRGALLSGYPLYPSGVLGLPVDWRVPAEQVAGEAAWIAMSARSLNSNVIYPGLTWIVPWVRGIVVRRDPFVHVTVPALLLLGCGVLAWRRRHAQHDRDAQADTWSGSWRLAWIPLGAGIAFWLASAPHTRTAQALLWSAAAIALARWAIRSADTRRTPAQRLATVVVGITLAIAIKHSAGTAGRAETGAHTRELVGAWVTLPTNGRWAAPLPTPELAATMIGDIRVSVPVADNSCWNTPTLCTPHPSSSLRLRRPGPWPEALGHGFRSEGLTWDPQRWPNPWTPFLAWWRCVRGAEPARRESGQACLVRVGPDARPAPAIER